MRNIRLLFGLFISMLAFQMSAQDTDNVADAKYPVITFEKSSHDFGTIHEKDVVETTFKFKNTGEVPLVIQGIRASCGCTVPSGWKREPILPGESGQFTVKFNSRNKPNKQHKRITITCNTKKGKEYANITATVIPDPELEKARQERYKKIREQQAKRKAEQAKKLAEKKKEMQFSKEKGGEMPKTLEKKNIQKPAKKNKKEEKAAKKELKLSEKAKSSADKEAKKMEKAAAKAKKINAKMNKLTKQIAKNIATNKRLEAKLEKLNKKLKKLK